MATTMIVVAPIFVRIAAVVSMRNGFTIMENMSHLCTALDAVRKLKLSLVVCDVWETKIKRRNYPS